MVNASTVEKWVPSTEAAAHLGVSRSFIFKGCASGSIPHVKIGRALRFRLTDLDAWASTNRCA
jgi:excisionase family DNA binding protein